MHYFSKVLKAKVNQKVVLFNNTGFDYQGCIKSASNKFIEIYIEKKKFFKSKSLILKLLLVFVRVHVQIL